ncbi:MAG: hypothetical protein IJT96_09095 [Lachnospiraceae bacterium]|nr:hypothetical protein [Lachnospiraceae bacterium]
MGDGMMWKAMILPAEFLVKDDDIWFLQSNSNQLICVDKYTSVWKKNVGIPWEPCLCRRGYNYLLRDEGERLRIALGSVPNIYFYEYRTGILTKEESVSWKALKASVTDETSEYRQRVIEICEKCGFPEGYIALPGDEYQLLCRLGDNVYIFPFHANMVVKVNLIEETVCQIYKEICFEDCFDDKGAFISEAYGSIYRELDKVYAFAFLKQQWHVFNLIDESIDVIAVPELNDDDKYTLAILFKGDEDKGFCQIEEGIRCNLPNYLLSLIAYEGKGNR